tara:strand:+ start:563 stop:1135 length:573 start_codon:yes stop_codon:yes gene_type:complete
MAHRPVGAGASIAITKGSAVASDKFVVKSNAVRLVALNADTAVAISTGPATAAATDYIVSTGQPEVIALNVVKSTIENLASSSTTTIVTLHQGQQCPFVIGDFVTLSGANDSNWDTVLTHKEITGINETTDGSMSYSTKLHLRDANTSGISTAYTYNSHATLSNSIALSTYGINGTGSLHYQQVQISGGA